MLAGALRLVVLSALLPAIVGGLAGSALAQQEGAQQEGAQAGGQQGGAGGAGGPQGGAGVPDDAGMMEQAAVPDAGETPESEAAARAKPVPAGLHLSTYASPLCARLDRTGAIDSGAAVIQLVDPESGEPLAVKDLAFGRGPLLWAGGGLELRDVDARMRVLATPTEHLGDQRVRVVLRVELINRGEESVTVKLAARLSPGGGDPLRRPADALDFAPGTRFGVDDGVVTRDGNAILAWVGPDPQVTVDDPPQSPEDTACTLVWDLPVQPSTARYLDLSLAGAAHQPVQDEEGWRQSLSSFSYVDLEEQLAWQTDFRGTYTVFSSAMPDVNRALDASLHFLRTLGEANREVVWLTDQPYGFPPTDAAVPAEITALFYEWGMAAFAEGYLRELVAGATASGQQLSPERRVALVAGLVSAVRLVQSDEQLVRDLADVIRALVVEGAAVEPWLDPQTVRADMAAILLRADPVGGAEAAERLPALQWSEEDEGPVAARMLAARKALSAGDREGFWEHYSALLEGTSRNGLGSMTPGGDLDGRFPIGFMSLSRAMLIDDHGPDLRLMAGANEALLPERDELDLPWLPTIFGLVDLETYRSPGRRLVTSVRLREQVEPNLIYVYVPWPFEVQKVVDSVGGKARLMPDGSVAAAIDPYLSNGLNFTVTAREAPPAER